MIEVLGVGLPRTGTQSLVEALRILGYETLHEPLTNTCMGLFDPNGESALSRKLLRLYQEVHLPRLNAITDPVFWRLLCEAYPRAKVILTIRGWSTWFRSIQAHLDAVYAGKGRYSEAEQAERITAFLLDDCSDTRAERIKALLLDGCNAIEWADRITNRLFGRSRPQRELYIEKYQQHALLVTKLCEDRDLLTFDVREGWAPLCAFLGKPVPEVPFPWANRLVS